MEFFGSCSLRHEVDFVLRKGVFGDEVFDFWDIFRCLYDKFEDAIWNAEIEFVPGVLAVAEFWGAVEMINSARRQNAWDGAVGFDFYEIFWAKFFADFYDFILMEEWFAAGDDYVFARMFFDFFNHVF